MNIKRKWVHYGRVKPISGQKTPQSGVFMVGVNFCLIDGFVPFYAEIENDYLELEFDEHIIKVYNPNQYKFNINQLIGSIVQMYRKKYIRCEVMKGKNHGTQSKKL